MLEKFRALVSGSENPSPGTSPSSLIPAFQTALDKAAGDVAALKALRAELQSIQPVIRKDDIPDAAKLAEEMCAMSNVYADADVVISRAIGMAILKIKSDNPTKYSPGDYGLDKWQSSLFQKLAKLTEEEFQIGLKMTGEKSRSTVNGVIRLHELGELSSAAPTTADEPTVIETTATIPKPDKQRAAAKTLKRAIARFIDAVANDDEEAPYQALAKSLKSSRLKKAMERATATPKKTTRSKAGANSKKPRVIPRLD